MSGSKIESKLVLQNSFFEEFLFQDYLQQQIMPQNSLPITHYSLQVESLRDYTINS